jgi:putative FmdB family regulatory protein
MPIYAYKCESCGHAKDVLQKMSDVPLVDCPTCGASAFKKQLTSAGFQLKGSGWYVTDFRDGKGAASGAADKAKDGEKSKESGSSEKSDTPASSGSDVAATTAKSTTTAPAPTPVSASPAPAQAPKATP